MHCHRNLVICIAILATHLSSALPILENEKRASAERNFLHDGNGRTADELAKVREALAALRKTAKVNENEASSTGKRNVSSPVISFCNDVDDSSATSSSEEGRSIRRKPCRPVQPKSAVSSDGNEFVEQTAALDAYLYQGDIALTLPQILDNLITSSSASEANARSKRGVLKNHDWPFTKWNLATGIPYFFDDSIDEKTRHEVLEVMSFWQNETCINFSESTMGAPALKIFAGDGCWSYIGRQFQWRLQELSVGKGCQGHFGVMAHEFGHALGLYHEQSRTDRDEFVQIVEAAVHPDHRRQFTKETVLSSDNLKQRYEYGSVMHYPADGYAREKGDIVLRPIEDDNYIRTMGQRMLPTFQDVRKVNVMYKCNEHCSKSTVECQNGGYLDARDCNRCKCPQGFGGTDCSGVQPATALNVGSPQCGGLVMQATKSWSELTGNVSSGATSDGKFLFRAESCHWHIVSPPGTRVEVMLTSVTNLCSTSCAYNSVDLKMRNLEHIGFRFCCEEDLGRKLISESELVVVSAYARYDDMFFSLRYRIAKDKDVAKQLRKQRKQRRSRS